MNGATAYASAMMSIHRISAGDGYEYYTKEVASADERRENKQELGNYYLKSGAPAGVWAGTAIKEHFQISGEVTEQQMRDLFGSGKRPDAQQIREAKDGVVDERNLLLGRPFASYPQFRQEFQLAVRDAEARFEQDNGRKPVGKELNDLRFGVARDMFQQDRNRPAMTDADVARFMHTQLTKDAQAVAGFDLTFSVPKSVSVAWALGDKETRQKIEKAHTDAVLSTVDYLEADVIGSRAGRNGVRRVGTDGIMAARFRHYDSRAGDPQLHDHLVVSNKVFCPASPSEPGKGVWRTIDSKALFKATVATSERYNVALMKNLADALGMTFEERGGDNGQAPKMEIADVDDALIEQFSTRRMTIRGRLDELVDDYKKRHGHEPSRKTRMQLAQRATLETRTAKDHVALPERMQTWREQTDVRFTADQFRHTNNGEAETIRTPGVDDAELARRTVTALEQRRATWTRRHIQAEAARQLAQANGNHPAEADRIDLITTRVIDDEQMIRLSTPEPILEPAMVDQDGLSVYDHPDMWRYTSPAMVDLEADLIDATERDVMPVVTRTRLDKVLNEARAEGAQIGDDKVAMISAFVLGTKGVQTAVGPAGAGKTTAMRYVAKAVDEQGGHLIGLAPSAVAARELGESLNVPAMTAQLWLTKEGWRTLRPGDMVIVDEAGMVDTRTLHAITTNALANGAVVRMVGDPMQLRAVEAGGAFDMLHKISGGVELSEIWRFKNNEEAAASLALRDGDEPFNWYMAHDRIKGGSEDEATAEAFAAWCKDDDAGKRSIIITNTTERVDQLNDMVQSWEASQGHTHPAEHEVTLTDGHTVAIGDTVLTRKNDTRNPYGRENFVKNGDLFTVTTANADGSLEVTAPDGSAVTLAPDYVANHTQLGYASTVHRAQGVTVDTAHAILDASCDRPLAYVAMTRGKQSNNAWIVLDDDQPLEAALDTIAARQPDNVSVYTAMAQELDNDHNPVRLRDIYLDVNNTADRARWANRINAMVERDQLPASLANPARSPRWTNLVGKLNRIEAAGLDAQHVLYDLAADLRAPKDPIAIMAWRLDQWTKDRPEVLTDTLTPVSHYDDTRLAQAHQDAQTQAHDALTGLKALEAARDLTLGEDDTAPAWTRRPYGHLTDAELQQDLVDSVEEVFAAEETPELVPNSDASKAVEDLTAERDLRGAMDRGQRRTEDRQRQASRLLPEAEAAGLLAQLSSPDPANDSPALAHAKERLDAAEEVYKAVDTETQRRRYRLPEATPAPADGLDQWTAPAGALNDPATPQRWRDALTTQRTRLVDAVDQRGHEALNEEPWANDLIRPAGLSDQQWERMAGEVATYRDTHRVGDHYPLTDTATTGAPDEAGIHQYAQTMAGHNDDQIAQVTRDVPAELAQRDLEQYPQDAPEQPQEPSQHRGERAAVETAATVAAGAAFAEAVTDETTPAQAPEAPARPKRDRSALDDKLKRAREALEQRRAQAGRRTQEQRPQRAPEAPAIQNQPRGPHM